MCAPLVLSVSIECQSNVAEKVPVYSTLSDAL